MKLSLMILALSSALLLGSCSQTVEKPTADAVPKVSLNSELPDALKAQLDALLTVYFTVKDDLVAGDSSMANKHAADLLGAIANVQATLIPEAEQMRWDNRKKELLRYSLAIQQQTDIEQQRQSFEPLTSAMYLVLTDIGAGTKQVYKQYCPMAFDDKGAFWLSDKEEIMNPYFGDVMLHCGVVKEVLSIDTGK